MNGLFIQHLADPDQHFYYFSWVFVVIVSIVLHELGHGWMALRLGDPTPRIQGRMTGNPLVHMGPLSLGVLFLTGLAWGLMPIDPSRLRGRYGEAKVALAGPMVNLALAATALVVSIVWLRSIGKLPPDNTAGRRGFDILWMFTSLNLLLMIFNLLPVPPLDGSHILANLNRDYANLIDSPGFRSIGFVPFIVAFLLIGLLITPVMDATLTVLSTLSGVGLELVER